MKSSLNTALLALILCLSLLTGCSKANSLVGKWQGGADGGQMEFTSDGKINITVSGTSINATYSTVDDSHFKMDVSAAGQTMSKTMGYKINGDTLTITDDVGKPEDFKRIK